MRVPSDDALQKFLDQASDQPGKEMHRIFFARKQVLNGERYEQPSALINGDTGELLTKKEDIDSYTLKYNDDLLRKNPPPGKWAKEREQKVRDLEDLIKIDHNNSVLAAIRHNSVITAPQNCSIYLESDLLDFSMLSGVLSNLFLCIAIFDQRTQSNMTIQ